MSDDADAGLAALERQLAALLACLSPGARARFTRALGKQLRENQQRRIAAQQNPDGSAYAPRQPQTDTTHRLRRSRARMFVKLRQSRWMTLRSSADQVSIQFVGWTNRMANVHQHGLRDRVNKNGLMAMYPARQLLGLSDADLELAQRLLLDHIDL